MALINRTLTPPDKVMKDTDEQIQELLEWVKKNYKPSDLFSYGDLEAWALENGFILNENEQNSQPPTIH